MSRRRIRDVLDLLPKSAGREQSDPSSGLGRYVPFARNESFEIKRGRFAALLALDERGTKGC